MRTQLNGTPGFAPFVDGMGESPIVQTSVGAALDRFGVSPGEMAFEDIDLRGGMLCLPLTDAWPEKARLELATSDLDEFKRWFGVPDPDGPAVALDISDNADVRELGRRYLFGDSRTLQGVKKRIEDHFAPFKAMLLTAGRIRLTQGARLVVCDWPACIVARELIIEDGSGVGVNVLCNLSVGRLIKLGPQHESGGVGV